MWTTWIGEPDSLMHLEGLLAGKTQNTAVVLRTASSVVALLEDAIASVDSLQVYSHDIENSSTPLLEPMPTPNTESDSMQIRQLVLASTPYGDDIDNKIARIYKNSLLRIYSDLDFSNQDPHTVCGEIDSALLLKTMNATESDNNVVWQRLHKDSTVDRRLYFNKEKNEDEDSTVYYFDLHESVWIRDHWNTDDADPDDDYNLQCGSDSDDSCTTDDGSALHNVTTVYYLTENDLMVLKSYVLRLPE